MGSTPCRPLDDIEARNRRAIGIRLVIIAALACVSCGPAPRRVELPDLSRSDPPVQAQLREAYAAAQRDESKWGELGMLLHAAEYLEAAEAAYLNAQQRAPDDPPWPYYLGHLYRQSGEPAESIEWFQRALKLQPSDVPTMVWLGRAYAEAGRTEESATLLDRARSLDARSPAVLAALGQAALARGDHADAIRLFEEALSVDPRALSVHASLATAYAARGDATRAEMHRQQWKDVEPHLKDPLRERLGTLLRSAVSYELRGVRAFDTGDWAEAARILREGLTLTTPETPIGRSLRHKLGIALYLGGDAAGGIRQFEEAARLAPASGHDEPASRAHHSLGLLLGASGRDDEAVTHLVRAVAYDETSLASRVALADALRRLGRDAEALPHYERAFALYPQATPARFGHALALIRLRRYRDARASLEESLRVQPDRGELRHALARLLATAPDPRVRDRGRASAIVNDLLKVSKRTEVGETMAMTLADAGQYEEAAAIQRGVIAATERAGLSAELPRMRANLRLYEQRKPVRTPWPDDDPIHRPRPPASAPLTALQ